MTSLLREVTGVSPQAFSYPYGTAGTVDGRVAARLGEAGYRLAFTMRRAANHGLEQPLLLARVDTNDAPGGTKPMPELELAGT